MNYSKGTRAVAILEASKGLLVMAAGFGLISIEHKDVARAVWQWMGLLHIDPMGKYPQLFLQAMSEMSPARIKMIATVAFAYSCLRFIEATGLWFEQRWAEWLAAVSGAVYLPFEFHAMILHPGPWKASVIVLNLAIVIYMAMALQASRAKTKTRQPEV